MTDPTRLLDDDGARLELRLLRAGKVESPPPAPRMRTLQFARELAARPPPKPPTTKTPSGGWRSGTKWAGIGFAILAGVAIVERAKDQPATTSRALAPLLPPAPLLEPEKGESGPWISVPAEPPEPSSLPALRDVSRKLLLPSRTPPPTVSAAPSNAEPDDLFGAELHAIDQARRAIAAGAYAEGIRLLDSWAVTFPRRHFDEEAAVLRIQAVRGAGDREGSLQLARQFLAAHPASPLAQRVRSAFAAPE